MTVIVGWLPWTLLLLVSLFSLKYHKVRFSLRSAWDKVRNADPLKLFVWLSVIVIFVFYCIPKSKRSVYLLPIYPFMAYLIAEYLIYLMRYKIKPLKIFAGFIAFIALLVSAVFIFVRCGMLTGPLNGQEFTPGNLYFFITGNLYSSAWAMIFPAFLIMLAVSYNKDKKVYVRSMLTSIVSYLVILAAVFFTLKFLGDSQTFAHGRNADYTLAQMSALEHCDIGFVTMLIMYLPLVVAFHIISVLCSDRYKDSGSTLLVNIFVLVFALFLTTDAYFLPETMTTRSDRQLAEYIGRNFKDEPLYSHIPSVMMHYFGTNFYAGDKIRQYEIDRPEHGILMIAERDREEFFDKYKDVKFSPISKTKKRMTERKDIIYFYRF